MWFGLFNLGNKKKESPVVTKNFPLRDGEQQAGSAGNAPAATSTSPSNDPAASTSTTPAAATPPATIDKAPPTDVTIHVHDGEKHVVVIVRDLIHVAEVAGGIAAPGFGPAISLIGSLIEKGLSGWEDGHAIEITPENIEALGETIALDPPNTK